MASVLNLRSIKSPVTDLVSRRSSHTVLHAKTYLFVKETIMGAPVVHFEITGSDGKALQEFYNSIFDWQINANNPMAYGLVDTQSGGKGIGGGIASGQDSASGVTIYVEVDDIQSYLDRIAEKGGNTVVPITEIPGMVTFAVFQDPQGNLVGLVKNQ